ncbi:MULTISPECIES: alpha/beta fold hydrolase [Pacificibacter]|uniref:alpha/beta fold hydrolase n=1 Tax=Pacificibacter TaxID=1042323 RepID=UPI001C07F4AC|nr:MULTISPECIES: alpha/beta fold hydrolase [Pacificibacter]MBU2935152.1 alpha/beta fold hydrolase [Pacificibacter marinus]MDO6615943.1 alpha/beta fold hydrolase [Pacificibacter sp. 1_MG-2023]
MSVSDPVVLIHGAWQGSWSWDILRPMLESQNFDVIPVDLPGNGADGSNPAATTFEGCLDYLDDIISDFKRVSVVGHSGGGVFASALAERNSKVTRIAYVAGMMLPADRTFADVRAEGLEGDDSLPGVAPFLEWSADGKVSTVPRHIAKAIFLSDCPADVAHAASAKLTPQGDAARSISLTSVDRVTSLPRFYIEAIEDLSLPIVVQRHMQALMPGALIADLPTGHVPQVSAPNLLADLLVPFLKGMRDAEALEPLRPLQHTASLT